MILFIFGFAVGFIASPFAIWFSLALWNRYGPEMEQ